MIPASLWGRSVLLDLNPFPRRIECYTNAGEFFLLIEQDLLREVMIIGEYKQLHNSLYHR